MCFGAKKNNNKTKAEFKEKRREEKE